MTNETQNNPLEFLNNLWGNMGFRLPGMVTPTLDTDELGKRIADLRAVEGWLKTNLGMLQMSIQALEMQRSTLTAFQQFSQSVQGDSGEGDQSDKPFTNPFLNPAAWQMPWNMMGGDAQPEAAPAESAGEPANKGEPKR